MRLPAAVRYGSVRLSAFGGRGDPKFRDAARVELHDRAQNISDTAFRLAPSVGTHTACGACRAAAHPAPSAALDDVHDRGGVVRRRVLHVRFTYFVLR